MSFHGNAIDRFLLRVFVFPSIRKQIRLGRLVALDVNGAMGDATILLSRALYLARKEGKGLILFSSRRYKKPILAFYPDLDEPKFYGPILGHIYHRCRGYVVSVFGEEKNVYHDFYNVRPFNKTAFHLLADKMGISVEDYAPIQIPLIPALSSKKHVLLNISSVSMGQLELESVRTLVSHLLDLGYEVYENVKGSTHFDDAKPIFPPYEDLIGYCENADLLITIRSGVADLAAQTKVKILCLHTHTDYMAKMPLRYFRETGILEKQANEVRVEDIDYLLG